MTTFDVYGVNGRYCGQVNIPVMNCSAIIAIHYARRNGYNVTGLLFVRV